MTESDRIQRPRDGSVPPLCIYHGNCADGFGAAWAVRHAFLEAGTARDRLPEFYPGTYQDDPPDCTGRHVILVDFCYRRHVMEEIIEEADKVTILDHHKSAMEECEDLINDGSHKVGEYDPERTSVYGEFDMDRSGAMIAWDYFNEGPPPQLLLHIQDRDLWRFELYGTREIQAALFSYPYDFEVWDMLVLGTGPNNTREVLDKLILDGEAIERKHHKDVAELVEALERQMVIGGHVVPAASLPYTMTSDAGHLMCERNPRVPFAACYWDVEGRRVFSLRSLEGGADVSEVAAQYGGGGHARAAGFRVPLDEVAQFEVAPGDATLLLRGS